MSAATCPRCGLAASSAKCARCGADLTRPVAAARPASDHAELILTAAADGSSGQRWTVTTDAAVIGRAPTADVHIDDRSISRTHCRITRDNDEFFIEDAGGQNGTFLNGERVRSKTRIANGSRIGVASVELTASVVAPVKAAVAVAADHTVVVDVSEALAAADAMPVVDTPEDAEPIEAPAEIEGPEETPPSVDDAAEMASDDAVPDEGATEGTLAGGDEVVAPASIDELGAAADEFWRRFDVVRFALQVFRDRYVELGGRDVAIEVAARAMVVDEQPGDEAVLLALGKQARRIQQLAFAAAELAEALGGEIEREEPSTEGPEE